MLPGRTTQQDHGACPTTARRQDCPTAARCVCSALPDDRQRPVGCCVLGGCVSGGWHRNQGRHRNQGTGTAIRAPQSDRAPQSGRTGATPVPDWLALEGQILRNSGAVYFRNTRSLAAGACNEQGNRRALRGVTGLEFTRSSMIVGRAIDLVRTSGHRDVGRLFKQLVLAEPITLTNLLRAPMGVTLGKRCGRVAIAMEAHKPLPGAHFPGGIATGESPWVIARLEYREASR